MTGRVVLFLAGIVVVVPVGIGAALFVPARFPNGTTTPVLVSVPSGSAPDAIADELVDAKVLGSKFLFRIAVRLRGGGDRILAGDYAFPKALSPWSAVGALTNDAYRVNEVALTFPEGFTSAQMAERLDAAGVVGKSAFLAAVATPSAALRALVLGLPSSASLEGYLFPDTYRFLKDSTATVVVTKMLENFATKRRALPAASGTAMGEPFHRIVILASILEREVKTAADRALAADLFWRRIELGIALQSDATVNFVTGKGLASPTLDDTKVESPYNTYLHPGLPPGPIGNPGTVSLTATLNPTANDYLYFLTPKDGTTVFSKTYDEHLANKAKYLSP